VNELFLSLGGLFDVFDSWLFNVVVNGLLASIVVPKMLRWRLLRAAGVQVEPARIGARVFFGGRNVSIGAGSGVNIGCFFDNLAPITIGREVSIGHQVLLLTSAHERGSGRRAAGPAVGKPIVVGDGAWIGARAVVMPGVTIGAGCTVGAGAVVTRDCLPGGTYVGVPARLVGEPRRMAAVG
jgi:maltose O-acetyltransferase